MLHLFIQTFCLYVYRSCDPTAELYGKSVAPQAARLGSSIDLGWIDLPQEGIAFQSPPIFRWIGPYTLILPSRQVGEHHTYNQQQT